MEMETETERQRETYTEGEEQRDTDSCTEAMSTPTPTTLTCRVGLLLLGVGELPPLILGPDPLLPQEARERAQRSCSRWEGRLPTFQRAGLRVTSFDFRSHHPAPPLLNTEVYLTHRESHPLSVLDAAAQRTHTQFQNIPSLQKDNPVCQPLPQPLA